jgi:hypothetical protein
MKTDLYDTSYNCATKVMLPVTCRVSHFPVIVCMFLDVMLSQFDTTSTSVVTHVHASLQIGHRAKVGPLE